jgi:hypothetical protein
MNYERILEKQRLILWAGCMWLMILKNIYFLISFQKDEHLNTNFQKYYLCLIFRFL